MSKSEDPLSSKYRSKPIHIQTHCENCGTELMLYDRYHKKLTYGEKYMDVNFTDDAIWYDEWVCPTCRDGIRMDWPEGELERMMGKIANG